MFYPSVVLKLLILKRFFVVTFIFMSTNYIHIIQNDNKMKVKVL